MAGQRRAQPVEDVKRGAGGLRIADGVGQRQPLAQGDRGAREVSRPGADGSQLHEAAAEEVRLAQAAVDHQRAALPPFGFAMAALVTLALLTGRRAFSPRVLAFAATVVLVARSLRTP